MAHWSIFLIWTAATVLSESMRLREDLSSRKASQQETAKVESANEVEVRLREDLSSRKASQQETAKVESANEAPARTAPDHSGLLLKFPRSSGRWQLGVVSENDNGRVTIKWLNDEGKIDFRRLYDYANVRIHDRIYLRNRGGFWVEGWVTALNDNVRRIMVAYSSAAGPVVSEDSGYEDALQNYLVEPPPIATDQALPPPVQPKVKWCDTSLWFCSAEHNWLRRPDAKEINRGTYGQVWKVVSKKEWDKQEPTMTAHAIKFPVSLNQVPGISEDLDCKDNREEVAKIRQLEREVGTKPGCENTFMQIVDDFPCLSPDPPVPSDQFAPVPGYVMDFMRGTINDWIKEAKTQYIDQARTKTRFDHCKVKVFHMVYKALKCFHNNDWVHGDFKVGNVLYKGRGSDECPLEVRLADFGMSGNIGSRSKDFYEHKYFARADYLPMDMFDMPDDSLYPLRLARTRTILASQGIFDQKPHYILHPALDWCSFAYAWLEYFGFPICTRPEDWAGNCGPMGSPRSATTGSITGRRIVVEHCS